MFLSVTLSLPLLVFSSFFTLTISNDISASSKQRVQSVMAWVITSSFKAVEQRAADAVLTDRHLRAVFWGVDTAGCLSTTQLACLPSFSLPHALKALLPHFPSWFPHLKKKKKKKKKHPTWLTCSRSAPPYSCSVSHLCAALPHNPCSSISLSAVLGLMMTYESRSPNCGARSHAVIQKNHLP